MKEGRCLGRRAAVTGVVGQTTGNFGAAGIERVAQDQAGVALWRLARIQSRELVGYRSAIDDRALLVDVVKAHDPRSAASRLSL